MMYADSPGGGRILATPGAVGTCPQCSAVLIAKCGDIVIWHWAHAAASDCDDWSEPDSAWHQGWQATVPEDRREVRIGPHRADVIAANGTVVELQRSGIAPAEIAERESFYGRMVWLFDAADAYRDGRLHIRFRDGYVTFRWKHPRKSLGSCNSRILLDLGNGYVMWVRRIHTSAPCGGWGQITSTAAIRLWMAEGHRLEFYT